MRVAAKAVNDGFVPCLEVGDGGVGVAREEGLGGGVDGGAFAVHQWQQGELALVQVELREVGLFDGFLRKDERHAVLGEGERAASVQVTRVLVEDDDFGEAAMRGRAPVAEFACRRLAPNVGEAGADVGVEGVAFREPPGLGFGAEPVVKDGLRGHGCSL